MLKLVVSNEKMQVRPLAPPRLGRFRAGEVLERRETGARVLVVGCEKNGAAAMLMPLPEGDMYEAGIAEMEGWEHYDLAGPRLVEVRWRSSKAIEWSSYLPDFDAALALWQKFEAVQPRQFEVQIYTQHPDEVRILERCGYFGSVQVG